MGHTTMIPKNPEQHTTIEEAFPSLPFHPGLPGFFFASFPNC
jgi:hypothetical protein